MRPYSPGGMLIALTTARTETGSHQAYIVYSQDYGVSNPVCSPGFRASASVSVQKAAFATGIPPDLYAFHRYTGNSAFLSGTQIVQYLLHFPG